MAVPFARPSGIVRALQPRFLAFHAPPCPGDGGNQKIHIALQISVSAPLIAVHCTCLFNGYDLVIKLRVLCVGVLDKESK